ncbi:MAG: hypothetical protein JXA25_12635 [Anaerolineales bacterium]|nr:hypothetical protein [Anaerolineales bacterium]
MQFLVLTEDAYEIDWTDRKFLLEEEAKMVWGYLRSGSLRNIWFTENRDAVLLFEEENEGSVRTKMETLPLVREQLIKYRILGLAPYTGLERLFDGTD